MSRLNRDQLLQLARGQITEMSPQELHQRLASGDEFTIVDIRERDEFVQGHLPGAIFVPRGFLELEIEQRQPDRAEMLMLEHVYQGRQGLRRFLEAKVATSSQADIGVVQLLAQHDASATGLDRIPTPSTSTSTTSPGTRKRGGARL